MRGDIMTIRNANETPSYSRNMILAELKTAGLEVEEVYQGITQPDGSTIWFADIKEIEE